MSSSTKLHTDLTALIVALEPHAKVMRKGRETAPNEDIMLAYRRVGGAIERLLAKAKLEQRLNRRGLTP